MWLYICTCLVLFNVVKSTQVNNQLANDKTDGSKQTEAVFVDVIKNISRVNNVLQELITNYEQLQKIYQSQENVASADSDSEIDEVFKSKKAKRSKKEKNATDPPNSNKYAATQMFWSDHEETDDTTDEDNKNGTKTEKEKDSSIEKEEEKESVIKKVKTKSLQTTVKTTTLKSIHSSESKDSDSSENISKEKVKEPKKIANPKEKTKSALNDVKPKQPNAEVIFIDTHKKSKQITDKTTKPKEVRPKIDPNIQSAVEPFKKKSRYSKVSYKNPINSEVQNLPNVMPNIGLNNTRKVKQIMYSESFAPKKIWLDIINNKPIQLEAHNEVTLQAVNNTNMRSKKKGINALVIVTESKKNKNKEDDSISSDDDNTNEEIETNVQDSISSDDEHTNEEIETNVLRQAYGDACLKMVVRKCKSACDKTVKYVCKQYKCKGKSKFKSGAKTECAKEFKGKSSNKTDELREGDFKSETAMDDNDDTFANLTKAGYLSMACLPTVESKAVSLRKSSPTSLKTQAENFNVLRDRFERACKKISSKKCNNACSRAYKKMCDKYKCSKEMKKAFKKNCRKQCKAAYRLYGSDSDSSSDSD